MLKKIIANFFLFYLLTVPITNAQFITRIDGTKISFDSLQTRIHYLMNTANISGLCISVFNNNEPVFTKAYGLANTSTKEPLRTSTVLYAASFSKAVFAYIVIQLVEQNVINLDKPLASYLSKPLPEYKTPDSLTNYKDLRIDDRYKKITARMCLDHTTGFPNWREIEPDKKLKIEFEPGTRYSYSGEGLCLLQFVIEQITGKDLETIAEKMVFKPLRMMNTSYVWQKGFEGNDAAGHTTSGEPIKLYKRMLPNAAGSLVTSFDDYVKFYTAIMQKKGLSTSGFNEMFTPQIRIKSKQQFGPEALINTDENDGINLSYGLGFGLIKTPFGEGFFKEGHGNGWQHYSIGFIDKKTAIIIMTNSDNGEGIFRELLDNAIKDTFTPWYWENYISIIPKKARPGYAFYCPPCGNSCDTIAHEYSGLCPFCKMPLLEQKFLVKHN